MQFRGTLGRVDDEGEREIGRRYLCVRDVHANKSADTPCLVSFFLRTSLVFLRLSSRLCGFGPFGKHFFLFLGGHVAICCHEQRLTIFLDVFFFSCTPKLQEPVGRLIRMQRQVLSTALSNR